MAYNAVQCIDRLRHALREASAARWTDRRLLELLNEGFLSVARETYCLPKEVLFEASNGIPTYPLVQVAKDFLALQRADWRDQTLAEFNDLDRWTLGSTAFQDTNNTEIRRIGLEAGSLVLYPPPTVSRYTGATVTVTRDSATVTVTAGTPGANSVVKGWIFGVGATPTKWYAIKAVSDTDGTITLQEPYREETAAGQASVQSSGAVRIKYAAVPPLLRLFTNGAATNHYYSAGTVTFTLDATTVAGSGTSWTTEFDGAMEIGQGTAAVLPFEHRWLKVRAYVSATSLRTWDAWKFATAAGASYLLTDQSPFTPFEERSTAAIYYAARTAFEALGSAKDDAARMDQFYGREMVRVKAEVAKANGVRHVPTQSFRLPMHPFFGGTYSGYTWPPGV